MEQELHHAIKGVQFKKVEELLSAQPCPIDEKAIRIAAVTHYNPVIFKMLAESLAVSRWHLRQAALKAIPVILHKRCGLVDHTSHLDICAGHVKTMMPNLPFLDTLAKDSSVRDNDGHLNVKSMYCFVGCNRDAAEILYKSGFRKVDDRDRFKCSPLVDLEIPRAKPKEYRGQYRVNNAVEAFSKYLDMCAWFQSKGVNLNRKYGKALTTPLHRIAARIGQGFPAAVALFIKIGHKPMPEFDFLEAMAPIGLNSAILQEIFKNTGLHERKQCPCTHQGALPFEVLLNEMMHRNWKPAATAPMASLLVLMMNGETIHTEGVVERVAKMIFGAIVYASMRLEHWCSSRREDRTKDPKDYHNIHAKKHVARVCKEILIHIFWVTSVHSGYNLPQYLTPNFELQMKTIIPKWFSLDIGPLENSELARQLQDLKLSRVKANVADALVDAAQELWAERIIYSV